jgi:hypothetical protein
MNRVPRRAGGQTRTRTGEARASRPRRSLVGACLLLAMVAGLGFWLMVTRPPASNPEMAPTGATATRADPTPFDGVAQAGGCTMAGERSTVGLSEAPPGLTWSVVGGNVVPSSPQGGPGIVQGPLSQCYSHDATGALLAAIRIEETDITTSDWQAFVADNLVPGPGTDAVIAYAREMSSTIGGANADGQGPAPVAGFKFLTYSDQEAVISIAMAAPGGGWAASTEIVEWTGGDWKLVPDPSGLLGSYPGAIPDLLGYVALEEP